MFCLHYLICEWSYKIGFQWNKIQPTNTESLTSKDPILEITRVWYHTLKSGYGYGSYATHLWRCQVWCIILLSMLKRFDATLNYVNFQCFYGWKIKKWAKFVNLFHFHPFLSKFLLQKRYNEIVIKFFFVDIWSNLYRKYKKVLISSFSFFPKIAILKNLQIIIP